MPARWAGFTLAATSAKAPVSGGELNLLLRFPAHVPGTASEPRAFETSPETHQETSCIYHASAFPGIPVL